MLGRSFALAYELRQETTKHKECLYIGKLKKTGTQEIPMPVMDNIQDIEQHIKYVTNKYVSYKVSDMHLATEDIQLPP